MVSRIEQAGGSVLGGKLVTDLVGGDGDQIKEVVAKDVKTGEVSHHPADAVVFAIGISGRTLMYYPDECVV